MLGRELTRAGGLARQLYQLARAQGKGDQDWGAYTTVLEQLAGTTVRYGTTAGATPGRPPLGDGGSGSTAP